MTALQPPRGRDTCPRACVVPHPGTRPLACIRAAAKWISGGADQGICFGAKQSWGCIQAPLLTSCPSHPLASLRFLACKLGAVPTPRVAVKIQLKHPNACVLEQNEDTERRPPPARPPPPPHTHLPQPVTGPLPLPPGLSPFPSRAERPLWLRFLKNYMLSIHIFTGINRPINKIPSARNVSEYS